MEIVDARGQVCPRPIIMTKNVFDELEEGTVKTQVDDMYCVENLQKYANGQGFEFSYVETDYGFETTIVKEKGAEKKVEETNGNLVLAFSSDKMGDGDEKLGKSLIKSYIYSVAEADEVPSTLLFFNYGIHLTTEGSEVIDDLKRIEEKGAKIMTCGACLDFYDRKEKLLIGEVTNMYVIYDTLSKSDRNVIIR